MLSSGFSSTFDIKVLSLTGFLIFCCGGLLQAQRNSKKAENTL
jgi:hypothetical protein